MDLRSVQQLWIAIHVVEIQHSINLAKFMQVYAVFMFYIFDVIII